MPKAGRPEGRFTQHRRIDKLREVLESEPRGLTLDDLARTLRITHRSVRRYLHELDGSTDLESIETTPGGAHLWRIKPSERGRAVPLRRAQAYAILATRRSLDVLKGSALFDEVDLALGHIEKIAQTPFRMHGRSEISGERGLEERFVVVPPPARSYAARGEDLDELFRAVADLRVLRYRPRTRAGEARAERVVFHPYAMVVHDGSIVVLGSRANARANADADVVPLEAMTEIRASETEHFELPPSFDVAHYVHGEFGVARPSLARARALVDFDARVADEVRAKKLHKDQRTATSSDGRLRVSIPVGDVEAFVGWVLSFGDAARVVEPPELARRIGETLQRAAARYR
ncbi:MAG: WYL domain-containing protein [Labilithrix sp.]|nr:WYL domain-containing protein [Labilithrix sp.]